LVTQIDNPFDGR